MELTSRRKRKQQKIRARRARASFSGDLARLSVFRSGKHIYAQIIDSAGGKTIASSSDITRKGEKKKKETATLRASHVGAEIARKAIEKKITRVVFDRGGYKYHGRIKTLADAARKGGLIF